MQTISEYLNGAASYVNVARKSFNEFVLTNVQETSNQAIQQTLNPVIQQTLNPVNSINSLNKFDQKNQSIPLWITEPFTLFLLGLGFFISFVYYTNNFVFHATALFYPAIRSTKLIQSNNMISNQLTRVRNNINENSVEQVYLRYWFIYATMTLSSYLMDYLHIIIPFYYHVKFLITVFLVFSLEKKPEIINQIYVILFELLIKVFNYFGINKN